MGRGVLQAAARDQLTIKARTHLVCVGFPLRSGLGGLGGRRDDDTHDDVMCESFFSTFECKLVDRTNDDRVRRNLLMMLRWTVAAIADAATRFRRVTGAREGMPHRVRALEVLENATHAAGRRQAA